LRGAWNVTHRIPIDLYCIVRFILHWFFATVPSGTERRRKLRAICIRFNRMRRCDEGNRTRYPGEGTLGLQEGDGGGISTGFLPVASLKCKTRTRSGRPVNLVQCTAWHVGLCTCIGLFMRFGVEVTACLPDYTASHPRDRKLYLLLWEPQYEVSNWSGCREHVKYELTF
jgi:hypothetical protein